MCLSKCNKWFHYAFPWLQHPFLRFHKAARPNNAMNFHETNVQAAACLFIITFARKVHLKTEISFPRFGSAGVLSAHFPAGYRKRCPHNNSFDQNLLSIQQWFFKVLLFAPFLCFMLNIFSLWNYSYSHRDDTWNFSWRKVLYIHTFKFLL